MADKNEVIDVVSYTTQGIELPEGKRYLVAINADPHVFNDRVISRKTILEQIGVNTSDDVLIYQIINDAEIEIIGENDKVDLSVPGFERFVVKESFIYNYLVDNDPETSDKKTLTANEILRRAAYKPAEYYLVELLPGGDQKSYRDTPEEKITLTHTPTKKFISIYRGDMPVS